MRPSDSASPEDPRTATPDDPGTATAAAPAQPDGPSAPQPPPIVVVMGVTGSGKSTVAEILAAGSRWDFLEGDDLHPRVNVEKMARGVPLTDDDRRPWLDAIAAWIDAHTATGRPGVVTCSALRRRYRDVLAGPHVVFVRLDVPRDVLHERVATRRGHFMPASLVDSQLDTLEPFEPDEQGIAIDATGSPAEIAATVVTRIAALPPRPAPGP